MRKIVALLLLAGFARDSQAGTLCVAHRGNSSEELENSLSALRSAVGIGTPVVEFDVRHTRDGQAIVLHDARLRRTARSKPGRRCRELLPVRRLSLAHIRENCVLNNGEDVPTLREALDELSRTGARIFLELKDMPNFATLRVIDEFYRATPELLRVISFKEKALDYVRANLPDAMLFGGTKLVHVSSTERGASDAYGAVTVHRPGAAFVRRFQAMGLEVGAWTIDSDKDIRMYFGTGADYVTTNRPRQCLAIAETALPLP